MKRSKMLSNTALLVLATYMFGSCKKDVLESKDLVVFMTGDYGSVTNSVTVPFLHTPVSVSGDSLVAVAASASRAVPAAVSFSIVPDTTMVAQYNKNNGTQCLVLPANTYTIVNPGKHKIAAGTAVSDSMQVLITGAAQLTNPGGYVLPLTVTGIEGEDRGVKVSSSRSTAYINVTYAFNNIVNSQALVSGTLASRTGWVSTVSNTTTGYLGPAMLDGSNTTAWRSSNSSTAAKWLIIDMQSAQSIKGFQITPEYISTGDNITKMTVSTSVDNVAWTTQGIWTGTAPATGSSATNPDLKGVGFIAPVQARYFRFDITGWVSGSRTGIAELNVVK